MNILSGVQKVLLKKLQLSPPYFNSDSGIQGWFPQGNYGILVPTQKPPHPAWQKFDPPAQVAYTIYYLSDQSVWSIF